MEYWDLYSQDRIKNGSIHERGKDMPIDFYHVVVHVWIVNNEGKLLLTQRSANSYRSPLKWECTCGSVIHGENSLQAALREVKEEVGIDLDPNKGRLITSFRRDVVDKKRLNDFIDVYAFKTDKNYSLIDATTKEVNDCRWIYPNMIKELLDGGEMINTQKYILDIVDEVMK